MIRILYEDEYITVCVKPVGTLSQCDGQEDRSATVRRIWFPCSGISSAARFTLFTVWTGMWEGLWHLRGRREPRPFFRGR